MHPLYTYIKQSLAGLYPDAELSAIAKGVLSDIFRLSLTELYTGKDRNFPPEASKRLEDIIRRLRQHEPLQYIMGETYFHGLPIKVTPDVLIPRPETAELTDWIASEKRTAPSILDIGTGSGCIPIALAKVFPLARISAWDISTRALLVAEENARINHADIQFAQVDVLSDSLPDIRTDILVSNPPYITTREKSGMQPNVTEWEPGTALFVPDNDPLLFYRRIADIGTSILTDGGTIYFETNQNYGEETAALLREKGYRNVTLRKDMSGNDRMIKADRP